MGVHSGSSFDEFLEEEGIREEVETAAIKRVVEQFKEKDSESDAAHIF
jgi:hypothetical protein